MRKIQVPEARYGNHCITKRILRKVTGFDGKISTIKLKIVFTAGFATDLTDMSIHWIHVINESMRLIKSQKFL